MLGGRGQGVVLAARPSASQVPLPGPSRSSGGPCPQAHRHLAPSKAAASLRAGPHSAFLALHGGPLRKGRIIWKWARGGDEEGERWTAGGEEALAVSLSASKGNFDSMGGAEQLSRQKRLYHQGRRCRLFCGQCRRSWVSTGP